MNTRMALENTGRTIARHPVIVLVVSAILTALGLLGASRLGVETDLAKMLPSDNPTAKSYTAINDAFSTTSVLVAVVEGIDRVSTINAANTFAERLRTDERTAKLVKSVRLNVNEDFVDRWGLMLQDEDDLPDTERILRSTRLIPLLTSVNEVMEENLSDGDDEEVEGSEGEDDATAMMTSFALFAKDLRAAIEGPTDDAATQAAAKTLADDFLVGDRYLFDPEGKTLLMTVSPTFDIGNRDALIALMGGARAIAAETTGAKFSFSGDVASESDEQEAINADVFYPSLISLAILLVLFFFSFHKLRAIMFATIALVAGIIIDLGFAAITVRDLNMITSSFGALLVGLGIDYGIHIAIRYEMILHTEVSPEDAMAETFSVIVLPVAIGAITTAIAFYSLCFSQTVAFRQFGLIAGTGILTTLVAAGTILPALLVAFPDRRAVKAIKDSREGTRRERPVLTYRSVARAAAFSVRHRVLVLAIAVVVTAVTAFFLPTNRFEYDMRKIGPQGTEAQATDALIGERFGLSTWQALATAPDLESARVLSERMKDAPLIRRVESLADYVPSLDEQESRLAIIKEIAANDHRVQAFDWDASSVAALTEEVRRLEMNLIELGDLAAASLGEDSMPVRSRTAMIREIFGAERGKSGEEVYTRLAEAIGSGDAATMAVRLAQIDAAFAADLDRRVSAMAITDRFLKESDLPADIRGDFLSPAGDRYLIVAQPSHGLAGDDAITRFSDGLVKVDPTATGSVVMGVQLSREVLDESRTFAIVVGILIIVTVWIGFRSFGALIICVIPFFMSLVWTFGIYPAFGSFSIVNALSMPLILGVGIDYAVHFLTAIRIYPPSADGSIDIDGALERTGKAVALSCLTTMIGFGSLAFAGRFRGIADLGMTLLIGITCCFIAAVFVLPAVESLSRKKGRPMSAKTVKEIAKEAI